uniref:Retrotransposon gag domain-containing protein n=1 Tax=Ananas comosus var. bracteatus TaxID=296719 RepID=A0A6V7Q2B9_ANACO|nr:unnamed protein product [Ananas comosus var. bracteatus]
MAPKRRYVRRTASAPPREVPELAVPPVAPGPAGPTEVQELRAQVAALTGRFDRLQELLEQQAAATAAAAGLGRGPPAPSVRAPDAAEGVGGVSVPVAAQPLPVDFPPTSSSSPTPVMAAEEAERERGYVALTRFTKFHSPTFDGEVVDPATVESWLTAMETLFEDIFTLEKDKVNLAAHCFEKRARTWWKRVKQDRLPELPRSIGRSSAGYCSLSISPVTPRDRSQFGPVRAR